MSSPQVLPGTSSDPLPVLLPGENDSNPDSRKDLNSSEPPSCDEVGYDPDLWLYRGRTLSLLKRYLRLSVEAGRLPSLLGREFFRTRVTNYSTATFEDAIIFVHDVERRLEQLDRFDRRVIASMVFQEHNHEEAAYRLRCCRRTVHRRFSDALDRTAELFLSGGLLRRLPQLEMEADPDLGKSCQEAKSSEFFVSDSANSENNFADRVPFPPGM